MRRALNVHSGPASFPKSLLPKKLDSRPDALKLRDHLAGHKFHLLNFSAKIRALLRNEIDRGANDDSFPVKPQRLVADIRRAMGRDDIVLVDTGAVKMWMARLYPT